MNHVANLLTKDRIGGLLVLAFSITYGVLILDIPIIGPRAAAFTARTMPTFLCATGVFLSLLLIVKPHSDQRLDLKNFQWRLFVSFCVLMVMYGAILRDVGFIFSTTIFLAIGFILLGERRWLLIMLTSSLVTIFFWLLMTQVLGAYLEPFPALDISSS